MLSGIEAFGDAKPTDSGHKQMEFFKKKPVLPLLRDVVAPKSLEGALPGPYRSPGRIDYLSLLASRSDSSKQRISSSRTCQNGISSLVFTRGYQMLGVSYWSLDVPDDGSGLVVHELDADLGNATARAWHTSVCLNFSQLGYRVRDRIPVRPRTRMTFTSLTGCLVASISARLASRSVISSTNREGK